MAELDACSGPDDPRFRAASLLADAWGPALDRSFRLGYENGHAAGYWRAEYEMAGNWHRLACSVRQTSRRPTQTELRARRGES